MPSASWMKGLQINELQKKKINCDIKLTKAKQPKHWPNLVKVALN